MIVFSVPIPVPPSVLFTDLMTFLPSMADFYLAFRQKSNVVEGRRTSFCDKQYEYDLRMMSSGQERNSVYHLIVYLTVFCEQLESLQVFLLLRSSAYLLCYMDTDFLTSKRAFILLISVISPILACTKAFGS